MKRLFALLMIVIGTTAYGRTLNADTRWPCPSMDWCCGEFCVDAELLIWRALDCEDDYGFTLGPQNNIPPGNINRIFTVTPSFNLGFRVRARYDHDCWFVDSRYTWFESADLNQVDRDANFIFLQGSSSEEIYRRGSTRLRYGYQDVNIRGGWNCVCDRCCQIYSWIEGRYAKLRSKRTITGFGQAGVTPDVLRGNRAASTFEGGGVGVGVGLQVQVLSCIEITTELAALGLYGLRYGSWGLTSDFAAASLSQVGDYQSKGTFLPAMDLLAKVAYLSSYCGWDFSLFIAWEINHYWDGELMGEPPVGFNGTAPASAQVGNTIGNRQCTNLGFGGPSVGFTVCY